MADNRRTFRVLCAKCNKSFHVCLPLTDPQAQGDADVIVECEYCESKVVVSVPRKYVEQEHLIRAVQSHLQ